MEVEEVLCIQSHFSNQKRQVNYGNDYLSQHGTDHRDLPVCIDQGLLQLLDQKLF